MRSNTGIIKQLYKYFAASDFAAVKELFERNIVWEQMEGFPNGGIYKGADDIINNVFNEFRQEWTEWEAVVNQLIEGENFVFVIGYYAGVHKLTGKQVKADFIHQYRLDSFKIVHFKQYTDTALIVNAMSLGEDYNQYKTEKILSSKI